MATKLEQASATTREFTLEFLEQITDDFSEKHIIGCGGYGVVYKGKLENGEEIALKKLHPTPGLDDTQFRNEFNNLMRAEHPNITRLVGYCYNIGHQRILHKGEYVFALVEERVLCFEYLSGGSLDKLITDEFGGLDWQTRFKIIEGICEGLNYLHNGCEHPIYHLDLKPANILLDKNLVPKIGDFGLSRLFPSAQTYITIKIIGTPGYMPPEYIERYEITSKYDVFSLGVTIVRIMAGNEGYSKCAHMSSQEFLEHVHSNWAKRMQETLLPHISKQIETCIKIALKCMEVNRERRPTIAEIVDDLDKIDTAETSLTGQIDKDVSIQQLMEKGLALLEEKKTDKDQKPNSDRRGGIVFSVNNRPPKPFDIFSSAISPSSTNSELYLTDGVSCNYNGRSIPPAALKTLLKSPKLVEEGGATDADVDAGHVSGLVFVSERDDGLETLYIALRFHAHSKVMVFALADIFGAAKFSGARLEDSGCIGGGYSVGSHTVDHCLVYVSTKDAMQEGRNLGTVVYKTSLSTGKTERLTPEGMFDLSPAVSPSGKMVAVASFQSKSWNGEIENLKTDIYVLNMDSEEHQDLGRKLLIKNGGWPSWGSDNTIFFHRCTEKTLPSRMVQTTWGVFRYNITTNETVLVTPKEEDAMTPAAISETKVAVAINRRKSRFSNVRIRHIEIFDMDAPPVQITRKMRPLIEHYNPFVLDGEGHIGYHRCKMQRGDVIPQNLHKVQSPVKDVSLLRVSGMFLTISKDGSKLAFVDSKFKEVWVADSVGVRMVYKASGLNNVISAVWNQNPDTDILYVCSGYSRDAEEVIIYAIDASAHVRHRYPDQLMYDSSNNAFPSSNPKGNELVFRSTRGGGEKKHTNLYIRVEAFKVKRLTEGPWIDTQCEWSPNGDWIVFLSSRDKPTLVPQVDHGLDEGYFSLYVVKASDPTVVIRLMSSGDDLPRHVNNPVFSPDGRSIAMTVDLAWVSVDPISLPKYLHNSDIFVVDIDPEDPRKDEDIKGFRRMTHSRYECGRLAWTSTSPHAQVLWNMLLKYEMQRDAS